MNLTRLFVVLIALVLLGSVAAGSAAATTADECQTQLASLRAHTVAAQTSFTNAQDFNGLLGKLDAASTKLVTGKYRDAVGKLVDFQAVLNALAGAAKPKVDPAVASTLVAEAQGVIDCINGIGTA